MIDLAPSPADGVAVLSARAAGGGDVVDAGVGDHLGLLPGLFDGVRPHRVGHDVKQAADVADRTMGAIHETSCSLQ